MNDIQKITTDRAKHEQWGDLLLKKLLNKDPHIKHCPTKDCSFSVELPDVIGDRSEQVSCPQCRQQTCYHADFNHNTRIRCQEARENRHLGEDAAKDAKAVAEYLAQRTKPCPKCTKRIEKNEGCNHMNCTQCHHHFCWLCLGDYNVNALVPHICPVNHAHAAVHVDHAAAPGAHVAADLDDLRDFNDAELGPIRFVRAADGVPIPDFHLLREIFALMSLHARQWPQLIRGDDWRITFYPDGWTASHGVIFINGRHR